MSVKQMSRVWELELAPNKRLVLLAYADHADDEGNHVFPSLARIAHKTGYHRDQVRRISRELVGDKLMVLVAPADAGARRPAEYKLTLENGVNLAPFKARDTGSKMPPDPPHLGANDPPHLGAPMQPEPSLEPSVKDTNVSSRGNAARQADASPTGFEKQKKAEEEYDAIIAQHGKLGRTLSLFVESAANQRTKTGELKPTTKLKDYGMPFLQAIEDLPRETLTHGLDSAIRNKAKKFGYVLAAAEGYDPKVHERFKQRADESNENESSHQERRKNEADDRQRQMEEVFGRTAT